MIPEYIQDPWEFEQLLRLYVQGEPKRVLEIGTNNGGTLYYWAKFATQGTTIVSADLGEREDYWKYEPDFNSWLAPGAGLHTIVGDSHSDEVLAEMYAYGPYDFIFIDGDHTYEGVLADWIASLAMAAPDGLIALHDINCKRTPEDDLIYGTCDVRILWREIKEQGFNVEEFIAGDRATYPTRQNPEKLGIGVVYL